MSASWLKRALVTSALAAGAMMLSGGVAHAGDLPGGAPDPVSSILQDQSASNTNSTDQDADPSASTDQVNINAPISILSSGANGGDVDQSNQADTDATAGNGNWTDQTVDQSQATVLDGGVSCWSCGSGAGSIDQHQTGWDDNITDQDADATATTDQSNVNAPISILSSGANDGDVTQSNSVATTADAFNSNATHQVVDQGQHASVEGNDGGHGYGHHDQPCGCPYPSPYPNDGGYPHDCGCAGVGSIQQDQTGSNTNDPTQDATANASTHQSNLNEPFAFLSSFGDHGCGCIGGSGGVSQSNDADTHAVAGNLNATQQWIGQYESALTGKGVAA